MSSLGHPLTERRVYVSCELHTNGAPLTSLARARACGRVVTIVFAANL
jgi:hypothetical protein